MPVINRQTRGHPKLHHARPQEIPELCEKMDDRKDLQNDRFGAEIRLRLQELDRKLEQLALQVGSCLDGIGAIQQDPPHSRTISKQLPMTNRSSSEYYPSHGEEPSEQAIEPLPLAGPLKTLPEETKAGPGSRRTSIGSTETYIAGRLASLGLDSAYVFKTRGAITEKVWTFLDDPESSVAAGWFARLWFLFISAGVMFTLVQTIDHPILDVVVASVIETIFDIAFLLEFLTRYAVCASSWGFIKSPYNMLDALAAAPIVLRASVGFVLVRGDETATVIVLLCVVPVLRMMKMLRQFQLFHLFVMVLSTTMQALKFLLFMLSIIVLVFSALVFVVEPRSNIATLPDAMWFTIVTMTTVGYGDVTPETPAGTGIISVLIISSVLYMAMPIGIVGNAFTQVWKDRDYILLATRTHNRLVEWGYTAHDIPALFKHFDTNGSGELSLVEFRQMIREMRVGLRDERVVELFETLDKDGGGSIDHKEFLRALFPGTYHEIYGSRKNQPKKEKPREREKKRRSSSKQRAKDGSPSSSPADFTVERNDS